MSRIGVRGPAESSPARIPTKWAKFGEFNSRYFLSVVDIGFAYLIGPLSVRVAVEEIHIAPTNKGHMTALTDGELRAGA